MIYQGTTSSILDELQGLIRLADEDMPVTALRWANLGYIDCVQRSECLQRTDTAAMQANCDSFTLPADVLMVKKLTILYPDGTFSKALRPVDLGTMLEARRSTFAYNQEVDRPLYTMVGENQIEVWPVPGSGLSLQFWYVRYPQALTLSPDSTPEIREPFGSRLILYAASVEASRFKKDPLIGDYEASYGYWLDRFVAHINRGRGLGSFLFAPSDAFVPHDPSTDLYQYN